MFFRKMKHRPTVRLAIIVLGIIFYITPSLSVAAPTAQDDPRLKSLTVILDWFLNPDHAPLIVAQQQGFFKKEGLRVKLIPPAQATDGPKLVAAGKADIAIDYQPQFTVQLAQGLPLAWAGTLVDQPLNCLIALQDGPVKSIADLKGKTVVYNAGLDDVMLKTMLEHHGLSLREVRLIASSQNPEQAILSHKAAAFTGGFRNFEVIQMRLLGQPARVFYPEKNGMPAYDELVFVVNKKEAHDPRIKKFIAAVAAGAAYLKKHPRQTWLAFAKAHPEMDNKLNRLAWQASIPYFADNPGAFNVKRYRQFAEFLKREGMIDKVPTDFRE